MILCCALEVQECAFYLQEMIALGLVPMLVSCLVKLQLTYHKKCGSSFLVPFENRYGTSLIDSVRHDRQLL